MISVCMATYNGQRSIRKQLQSIIEQLSADDEIIIVDDSSTDETVVIIEAMLAEHPVAHQIIVNDNNRGPIGSFEVALQKANGDYIFLSDQDDIWFDNKVSTVMQAFKAGAQLVVHDGTVVDGEGNVIDTSWNHYNHNQTTQSIMSNIVKNGYTGAMMAFTKQVREAALPFPKPIVMHDQWLFQVSKLRKLKIMSIDEPLMYYVRHGNNVTGMRKRKKSEQLIDRLNMVKCLMYVNRK